MISRFVDVAILALLDIANRVTVVTRVFKPRRHYDVICRFDTRDARDNCSRSSSSLAHSIESVISSSLGLCGTLYPAMAVDMPWIYHSTAVSTEIKEGRAGRAGGSGPRNKERLDWTEGCFVPELLKKTKNERKSPALL